MKFISEYFLSAYLEQEDLSSGMKIGTVFYLPDYSPERTPYIAYKKTEDSIRAVAIHESSVAMTGGMQSALLFPIVPIQIPVEDDAR